MIKLQKIHTEKQVGKKGAYKRSIGEVQNTDMVRSKLHSNTCLYHLYRRAAFGRDP